MGNSLAGQTIKVCGLKEWGACKCTQICETHKPEEFKLVVAGGRSFNDYGLLERKLDNLLRRKIGVITIVSGTARGADKLGEQYAATRGFKIERYPADWDTHGKGAGHIRNSQMADVADAVVVFWDGVSKGTKNMIDNANKRDLPIRIIKY